MPQVITSSGVKWTERFVVLSEKYLAFAKHFDKDAASKHGDGPLQKWQEELLESAVSFEDLKALFRKHDKDNSQALTPDEAVEVLKELNIFTSQEDFDAIFRTLDVNESGDLSWEEFKVVAKHSAICNQVVDFIPLEEIEKIDWDVQPKDFDGAESPTNRISHRPNFHGDRGADAEQVHEGSKKAKLERKKSFAEGFLSQVESITGWDIDGDGKAEQVALPKYNPDTHEIQVRVISVDIGRVSGRVLPDPETHKIQLVLATMEGGSNSGRLYIHVLPPADAQVCQNKPCITHKEPKYYPQRDLLTLLLRSGLDQPARRRSEGGKTAPQTAGNKISPCRIDTNSKRQSPPKPVSN